MYLDTKTCSSEHLNNAAGIEVGRRVARGCSEGLWCYMFNRFCLKTKNVACSNYESHETVSATNV